MKNITEEDIEEVIQKLKDLKNIYKEEINNNLEVSKLYHEIVYYYRDLLTMGYNLHNMPDFDREQLQYIEKLLIKAVQQYHQEDKNFTLNEQVEFINNMNLSEENKTLLIKALYDNFNVPYVLNHSSDDIETSDKKFNKKPNC